MFTNLKSLGIGLRFQFNMADELMHKISTLGRKVTSRMSCVSFKMKEFFFFHGQPSQEEKMVEEATSDTLDGPDWPSNLYICDAIDAEEAGAVGVVRSIKRRIAARNPRVQYLALVLLETCVKNCEAEAFSEAVEAERVADEVVGLIEDPRTVLDNTRKAMCLMEAWGGSVYQETVKVWGLKSRGIRFQRLDTKSLAPRYMPLRSMFDSASYAEFRKQAHRDVLVQGFTSKQTKEAFDVARDNIQLLSTVLSSSQQDALKDNLTGALVHECLRCQFTIHKIIETTSGGSGANDCVPVLSEALNLSDELQKVLMEYEISRLRPPMAQVQPAPEVLTVAVEPAKSQVRLDDDDVMDELDKMIFGKKGWSSADLLHS
ncbi:TOM1-like protein 2 [Iris pallida]|uniref:TOM1-like protein 2 n=1 Tax=Iris pallida TaxID=29817 RepID=A0AAX6EYU3_IRIPA|nr:TOM1-like protein 2 [Iris pallida]